jgi:hypothetical protein
MMRISFFFVIPEPDTVRPFSRGGKIPELAGGESIPIMGTV